MKINKEGYKIIAISGLICLVFWLLLYYFESKHSGVGLLVTGALLLIVFWFFIVAFFREIFMSITNVHMNWVPVSGTVEYYKYHPGRFLIAYHPKSSTENERTTTVVRMENGKPVLFRQIAGLIARRIVSYMKVGDHVSQNDVFGFIKFGSRIDVLVPKDSELLVEIGDPVVGSQTPIVRLRK